METRRTGFKRTVVIFVFAVFILFLFMIPPVFAQGENPSTPTPYGTMPPFPDTTPEPFFMPEIPQESPIQSLNQMESTAPLGGDWAAQVNISDTADESTNPKIATDNNGILHFVWRETVGGKQEIFYSRITGLAQSMPVNVSNSPSFNSDSPQIVADSIGTAHIVWQEEDNDHADDFETLYSRCDESGCTPPMILSDGNVCSSYSGDWKAVTPTIGINTDNNLIVAWISYEPNPKNYLMYSIWPASSSPPTNRTGCHPYAGLIGLPLVAGDSNGNFHLVMLDYSFNVYYSSSSSGSWTSIQNIGTGYYPVIFIDENNKIHTAWSDYNSITPLYRSREGASWSSPETAISNAQCYQTSLATDQDNLPRLVCAGYGTIYETSRQPTGWTEATNVIGDEATPSQPNLAKDINGNLHLVWSDVRTGNRETFYSPTYNCEGIEPATTAGQAVLDVLESDLRNRPFLNYCKNLVEEIILVPAPGGQDDPKEAFKQWADLASSAAHEVAFTVMFWDRGSPGEIVLQGIRSLYDKVINPSTTIGYPHGMTVRILLGVKVNAIAPPWPDQRDSVLRELQNQDIPIYKTLPDGRVWKIQVGVYREGLQWSKSPGAYSHVKLMVVDSNKMIVSGYHPQYAFQTAENGEADYHDLGIKVAGPIAANGMAVFDSLWADSEIKCTEEGAWIIDNDLSLDLCGEPGLGENPTHWFFVPTGDDIALPLYRDLTQKVADMAVEQAIKSANTQVYVIQNRVGVSGNFPVLSYGEDGWLNYANALLKEALENTEVRILFSRDTANFYYNLPSMLNFMDKYYQEGGQEEEWNIFRFYHPEGYNLFTQIGLHAKTFMIDGEFLVIGSQNFDHSAFGSSRDDLDLVEYSLGIEDSTTIINIKQDYYSDALWNSSIGPEVISPEDSFKASVEQASPGAIIFMKPGYYEISSPVTIPEGVTVVGLDAVIRPSVYFVGQTETFKLAAPNFASTPAPLLHITGSNVTLIGLTLQNSSGYAIEIGDGSTAIENVYLSRLVFENNALGGVHVQGPADGGLADYTIENNTFVGGGSGVTITASATATGIIRNNIFAGQSLAPVQITSENDGNVEYNYNLFYACASGGCADNWHIGNLGVGSNAHDNLFDLNPLFANPAFGDYHLSSASPAIDIGDPDILNDLVYDGNGDGLPRIDMGAFEYLGESGGPTPTVAPSPTLTATPTLTWTPIFTFTPTLTRTPTSTFTPTPSPTPTLTRTSTATFTPTVSLTPTFTLTSSPTPTKTSPPTSSPTQTGLYQFTGFFPPVDNQPILNELKAGSAVPIKFSLGGYQGMNILAEGYPVSGIVTCGFSIVDAIEQTVTAESSSLSYDASYNQYIYVWKTNSAWSGACRTFVMKLLDGSYHRADFKFRK